MIEPAEYLVGMYIGTDRLSRYRFISSRKRLHGPTFADSSSGKSVLDGTGRYPRAFRAVRRL